MSNSEKILSALQFIFEKRVREKRKWYRITGREKEEETYFFCPKNVWNNERCFKSTVIISTLLVNLGLILWRWMLLTVGFAGSISYPSTNIISLIKLLVFFILSTVDSVCKPEVQVTLTLTWGKRWREKIGKLSPQNKIHKLNLNSKSEVQKFTLKTEIGMIMFIKAVRIYCVF